MLRILLGLIAGIGLEIGADHLFHLSNIFLLPAIIFLVLAVIAATIIGRVTNVALLFKLNFWNGLALSTALVSLGYVLTWYYTDRNYNSDISNFLQKDKVWTVKISEPPVVRPNSISAVADVQQGNNENGGDKVDGKLLLTFLKDSLSETIAYGDEIVLRSKIEPFDEPKNPDEFNFKQYQSFHNIYYRAFVTGSEWKIVEKTQGNFFFAFVYRWRTNFLRVIEKYVKDKNDFAVASALMLGYRDYIGGDIIRAYASSGAVHILSVSGLHVTVMFFILNFLLKGMDKRGRRLAIAKAAIIISFIWFYACLTGMSPPVLRSAVMFTLIQLAGVFIRHKNIYNIVSASAVLLLLFDPFFLMDAGFQLSYLAVIGIVYLFPKLYSLIAVKNRVLDKIWGIVAVSIVAQIATLPLSFYYFHQFPNLFLLSNMVVIPLSEFVLYTGTALFAFSHIPLVGYLIGWVFNELLVLLDKFIFWVDTLPFALVKGISITVTEMVFAYLLLALLAWLTEERKKKVVVASLLIVFALCSFHSYRSISNTSQKIVVVYDVPKYKAIAFISGTTVQYDFDSALLADKNAMQMHINNHWYKCGVKKELPLDNSVVRSDLGEMICWEDKKILIVDSACEINELVATRKLKCDMVIVSGNSKVTLEELNNVVDFDQIVFDSSNKPHQLKMWKQQADKMKLNYWDVKEKGAFIVSF